MIQIPPYFPSCFPFIPAVCTVLDFLYRVQRLNYLHLSNNTIVKVNPDVLAGLTDIRTIDLSHNKLTSISDELQLAFQVAEYVNLAHNQIFSISAPAPGEVGKVTAWRDLDISFNTLKYLPANAFTGFPRLEILNISHNTLINIDDTTFKQLEKLQSLDLSGNELQNVALHLPESVHNIQLGNNSIRLWPLHNTPAGLLYLDVHGNELSEIFPEHETVPNLKVGEWLRHNFRAL